MKNEIVQRIFYAVKVKTASPLTISGGVDTVTKFSDHDVLRNLENEVFIPGSSLAGAFREYLNLKKDCKGAMGFSKGEEGAMSPILVSDMFFTSEVKVSIRDHVELKRDRTVNNKYDTEIIETGAEAIIYLEVCKRKNDDREYDQIIAAIIHGMANGEIRFGYKKNRGYGRINVLEAGRCSFENGEYLKYLSFIPRVHVFESYEFFDYKNISNSFDKYVTIRVPLQLVGGISIRKYSAKPGEADYEHITCNGRPVIPGNSWNGAIRSDAYKILKELKVRNSELLIDEWFGYVNEKANRSLFIINESEIEGGISISTTRNKINRFTAATYSGALYTEKAHYLGRTELVLMIRKDESKAYKALIGLLLLIITDLKEGFISVGGQGAVGKGIFQQISGDEEIKIINGPSEEECNASLYAVCSNTML